MNTVEIEEELLKKFKMAVKDFKLKNKLGDYQNINVLTGLLPPKEYYKNISEYPFVLIRTHVCEDEFEKMETDRDFVVYFGICADKENQIIKPNEEINIENYQYGHRDLHNLYEKIRASILKNRNLISEIKEIGFLGSFQKIKFESFLEQPYPYFLGQMNIKINSEIEGGEFDE